MQADDLRTNSNGLIYWQSAPDLATSATVIVRKLARVA